MLPHNLPLRAALTRSLAEDGFAPRAVPFHRTTVRAFQVSEGRTYGVNDTWTSVEDALAGLPIVRSLHHKDHVLLREESERGVRIHVYVVRQKSQRRYVHRDHITRAVRDLYLEEVTSFDAGVLG